MRVSKTLKKGGSRAQKKNQVYGAGLLVAVALFTHSLSHGAPQVVLSSASAMLAQTVVGASASVAPNPYNSAVEQIAAKEAELTAREEEIADREKAQKVTPETTNDLSMYSFFISIALALLVGMNFYFDWRRGRRKDDGALRTVNLKRQG